MGTYRDYYFPNTEPLGRRRDARHRARHRPAVRAPRAGQHVLAGRARQRRQVRVRFRVRLANATSPRSKSRIRTSPPTSRRTCTPTTSAISPRSGSAAGPAAASSRSWSTVRPGPKPKYGIEHFVRRQMESFAWDTDTRLGLLPDVGAEVEVHEFDYRQIGNVYDQRGVVIKSFPAVHIYDGPVSYRLEWNGLTLRLLRRYHAEPVLCRQRARRRPADPRMFQHGQAADRALGLRRKERARHRHHGAHGAGRGRARARPGEAAARGGLSFLQRFRHRTRDRARHPQALPWSRSRWRRTSWCSTSRRADRACALAITPTHVWPNKERHDGFRTASRKQRLQMSRWLADTQLFPKF